MLVFIAIYNTSFLTVVTLGGTVLGSALIGLCSVLLVFLLRKGPGKKTVRCVLGVIGCCAIVRATAAFLPGWEIKPDMGTALFLIALGFLISEIGEYILNDEIRESLDKKSEQFVHK